MLGDGKKSIPVFISFSLALSLTVSCFTPPAVNFKYLEKACMCVCVFDSSPILPHTAGSPRVFLEKLCYY